MADQLHTDLAVLQPYFEAGKSSTQRAQLIPLLNWVHTTFPQLTPRLTIFELLSRPTVTASLRCSGKLILKNPLIMTCWLRRFSIILTPSKRPQLFGGLKCAEVF